ncbi:YlaH-like family protein [Alteribacillus iranensis]|uniref:YlaH-like protein n=1 Tax=Alteribacillus iranensis TaxID=930128 RepID=A0A1I2AEL8_9BACI|nr:YlaH-like family protein [Alteribacillus iranensis]SFE42356.1 YlaH-like protein [Alteribacillus iranensis]
MNIAAVNPNSVEVTREQLSWMAGVLNVHESPILGFWLLYAAIIITSVIVYNLGFAKKLSVLKNVVIYILLLIGALPLTIFAIGMPVVESLLIAAAVLGGYRIRHRHTRKEQGDNNTAVQKS